MENEESKRLRKRMDELERRLADYESSNVILGEKKVIAGERELEGKTYTRTADGGIFKEVRTPVCDSCGRKTEEFNACTVCGRKICTACSIKHNNKTFCDKCLREVLPLTKQEYMVLSAIENGLMSIQSTETVTKIRKEDIMQSRKSLEEKGFIERKGFLFFHNIRILDKGLEALAAYAQVYGIETDVENFYTELRGFDETEK